VSAQVIERGKLGELDKVGQGGQGVVYRAPNVTTKFAASMVYKEYKPAALAGVDFGALSAMPALVEDTLSYAQAERLVSIAAWPCAIVQEAGSPTGFVMPAIPDDFFVALTTVKGVTSTTGEFQHLLNHTSVLAARGITVDDVQRYTLVREAASGLAFLHKHGVCVGDVSPKNLLFCLTPREAVFFIDCDAMRINGTSALAQVETPGWSVPAGEELATIYSDTYKLGLLALRLIAGDQDSTNPAHLPAATPTLLRQIITDTLSNPPATRPLPEAWTYVLGHAIEQAQHDKLTAAKTTVLAGPTTALSVPTVRTRASAPPTVAASTPPGHATGPLSAPTPPTPGYPAAGKGSSAGVVGIGVAIGLVIVVAVIALIVGMAHNNATSSTGAESSSYSAPTTAEYSPRTAPTQQSVASPPIVSGPDNTSGHQSCDQGYSLNRGWGSRSGRGSTDTSCYFASSVLTSYFDQYGSASRQQRSVSAPGAVDCRNISGATCDGSQFIMQCAAYGNDGWITCTGGHNAIVYLY
jgi:hypothetical protein